MMDGVLAALSSFAAVVTLLPGLRRVLLVRHRVVPVGPRSCHRAPTPTSAGLIVVPVALGLALPMTSRESLPLLGGAVGLWLVGALDDRFDLPVLPRLAAQVAAVVAGLFTLGPEPWSVSGWSAIPWLGIGLAWLAFVNFFNFMDGIDGLAGSEVVAICVGLAALEWSRGEAGPLEIRLLWTLGAAALGFLVWNWPPARIFLGDSGSLPLGFLLGWLLLRCGFAGAPLEGLILASCFLVDPAITLVRRIGRGERFWLAHREHFYQRAVLRGVPVQGVLVAVAIANSALIGLAVIGPHRLGEGWVLLGVPAIHATLLGWMRGAREWRLDAPTK